MEINYNHFLPPLLFGNTSNELHGFLGAPVQAGSQLPGLRHSAARVSAEKEKRALLKAGWLIRVFDLKTQMV